MELDRPASSSLLQAPSAPAERGYHGHQPPRSPVIDAKTFAATLARWCQEKKAEDVVVYRVAERLGVADYFLLVTGLNRNHVRALENELHVRSKEIGQRHQPIEGKELHWWVVLDFSDVVVHLLQPEARAYYDLDRLYHDCPRLDWEALPVADDLHAAEA
jgi:ribosome-associated protein